MLTRIYRSNTILWLIFVVSILVDSLNGWYQAAGISSRIGVFFRGATLILLFPTIFSFKPKVRNFFIYFISFLLLYTLAFFYWSISGYDLVVIKEIDLLFRLVFNFSFFFYFLQYGKPATIFKFIRFYGAAIAAIIIFTFITGTGYYTYDEDYGFGTKGFFIAGNDLGLTLVLALTACFMELLLYPKAYGKRIICMITITVGAFLLGSRVSMIIPLIIWCIYLCYYIFFYKSTSRRQILLKSFIVGILLPISLYYIYNLLTTTYDAFDTFTKERLSLEGMSSARNNLVDLAKENILNFVSFDWLLGRSSSDLYLRVGRSMFGMEQMKSIEADLYEIIGCYGFLLGGMIYTFFLLPIFSSTRRFLNRHSIENATFCLFFCLFIIIGYFAGHAILNVMSMPIYAFVYVLYKERNPKQGVYAPTYHL